MKKNLKKLVLFFLLLLILFIGGGWFLSVNAAPKPKIEVDFPRVIPLTLNKLPVRVIIPHPLEFGYPRVPVEIKISFVGYRNQGVIVPLIVYNDLSDVEKIFQLLNNSIQVETEVPIPVVKKGVYRIVIDVKCIYGPRYSLSYWYSYTVNYPLEITSEKIRIVSGPEIIKTSKGYFGKFYGYKFSQAVIYDWYKKGISYTFKVRVIDSNVILYEEPAAVIGIAFEEEDLNEEYIEKEKRNLYRTYNFLLKQFPSGSLDIEFVKGESGNWRWLFANQPPSWLVKNGVMIEAALPVTPEGIVWFQGLDKIEWPGLIWSPWQEFQLEVSR